MVNLQAKAGRRLRAGGELNLERGAPPPRGMLEARITEREPPWPSRCSMRSSLMRVGVCGASGTCATLSR